ncbi:MAG: VOC family protein [Acidimicrobiaceae bacterium]
MAFVITLDVNDAEKMIKFWSTVLKYELRDPARYHDAIQRYWSIADPNNNGPRIVIQRVPEPVTAKTRIHIDVHVDDIEAEAKRAVELGAKRVDTEPMNEVGATWVRMLDPEGNPFCFVLNSEK